MPLPPFFFLAAVTDLLVLASLPSTSGEAVSESLQFIISLIGHAEKHPERAGDLAAPLAQIAQLGGRRPQELTAWLRRLVLGSAADGSSEIKSNIGLLRKLVDLLTLPTWYVCVVKPVVV